MNRRNRSIIAFLFVACILAGIAHSDEGLWIEWPSELIQKAYGFSSDDGIDMAQADMLVQFVGHGSGTWGSSAGYVITNHHVVSSFISDADQINGTTHLHDGYLQLDAEKQIKLPGVKARTRVFRQRTDILEKAIPPSMNDEEAEATRRRVIAETTKSIKERTGLEGKIECFFGDAVCYECHYSTHTDVRLVWAPEKEIAFFGGMSDNFSFPRYCLDAAVVAVYDDDGNPVHPRRFVKWASAVDEGDLIFVRSFPGWSDRFLTYTDHVMERDIRTPVTYDFLRRRAIAQQFFADKGVAQEKKVEQRLFRSQNSLMIYDAFTNLRRDPSFHRQLQVRERALRAAAEADPELVEFTRAWDLIDQATVVLRELYYDYMGLYYGRAIRSDAFDHAFLLVNAAYEKELPDGERLETIYTDARSDDLRKRIENPTPLDPELDALMIEVGLKWFTEYKGVDHPICVKILAGKSIKERARELANSVVADVDTRLELLEGGVEAIEASDDPMIALLRSIRSYVRSIRLRHRIEVRTPRNRGYAMIAKLRGRIGGDIYPDANSTLRFSFGIAKGTESIPWATTVKGLYEYADEHNREGNWELPQRWLEAEERLLSEFGDVLVNIQVTADTMGGSSGSSATNTIGELVGMNFDGNLAGAASIVGYSSDQRTLLVAAEFIQLALRQVYGDMPGAIALANRLGH